MSVILDNVMSLALKAYYGTKTSSLYAISGTSLTTAQMEGVVYNSTGQYATLLDAVFRENEELLDWESSIDARLMYRSTQEFGMLKKNGVILDDDKWQWTGEQHIQLVGDVYSSTDVWEFSYEQKKEVLSPVFDIGVVSSDKKIIVDGYVYQQYQGRLLDFNITESIKFKDDFSVNLQLGWCLDREGELITRAGRVVTNFSFVDERKIVIDPADFKPNDEYVLTYKGYWNWLDYSGVEVYVRYSNTYGSWPSWVLVEFGKELPLYRYYQIRLRFRKPIQAGDVRVRSLCIKVL